MSNGPVLPVVYFPGIEFLIFAALWGLAALVLYGIIRFGVKHGMRSYYASVSRAPGPDPKSGSR